MIRPLPLMLATSAIVAVYGFARTPSPTIAQTDTLSGLADVIDGDTIRIDDVYVRLFGIDAPESEQTCKDRQGELYRCGLLATAVLEEEVGGRSVTCFPIETDHYDRTVATCEVAGRDLGDAMVRRGYAIAYLRYSSKYEDAEIEARTAKRGIWQGAFQEPERWRREHLP
jgi:endonuclease YncB( thermonuclease family)